MFIGIIFVQVLVVIFLFIQIRQKSSSAQKVSVYPIDSKKIKIIASGSLKYFSEYTADPNGATNETVERTWLPNKITYTINKDSLNERFDYPIEKEKGVFRIITLGDSYTFGAFVNTKENWTELLEDQLNSAHICGSVKKYEVINLGGDGYDMAYETEKYARRGVKYNPDLVIMFVVDFGRISDIFQQSYIDLKLTDEEKTQLNNEGKYTYLYKRYDSLVSTSDRIKYQKKYFQRLLSIYPNKLLLVDHEKNPLYKNTLDDMGKIHNIVLERTKQPLYGIGKYHLADGHPSPKGHEAIMQEIEAMLLKDKLIPCK